MRINEFLNQVFVGDQVFHTWEYDDSLSPDKRKELGVPYSLVCAELDDNTIIAYGTDPDSPRDFMKVSGRKKFKLDASKTPRIIDGSMLSGEKRVFYTKLHDDENIRTGTRIAQFTLNVFKNSDNIFGAPENGNLTPILLDMAFEEIEKKLKDLRGNVNDEMFEEKELGSFFFEVNFHSEAPFNRVKWHSSGISFADLNNIIGQIYNNIPSHMK